MHDLVWNPLGSRVSERKDRGFRGSNAEQKHLSLLNAIRSDPPSSELERAPDRCWVNPKSLHGRRDSRSEEAAQRLRKAGVEPQTEGGADGYHSGSA